MPGQEAANLLACRRDEPVLEAWRDDRRAQVRVTTRSLPESAVALTLGSRGSLLVLGRSGSLYRGDLHGDRPLVLVGRLPVRALGVTVDRDQRRLACWSREALWVTSFLRPDVLGQTLLRLPTPAADPILGGHFLDNGRFLETRHADCRRVWRLRADDLLDAAAAALGGSPTPGPALAELLGSDGRDASE